MSEVTDYWKPELEKAEQTIRKLSAEIARMKASSEQPGGISQVREALRYIVERENFAFAECSEAEAIWSKAKESLTILDSFPMRESVDVAEIRKFAASVYTAIINHPLLPSNEDAASILNPLEDLERVLCEKMTK